MHVFYLQRAEKAPPQVARQLLGCSHLPYLEPVVVPECGEKAD